MFQSFKGQKRIKAKLAVAIHQGKMSGKMPHLGLFAPAGYGKTALAALIAKELEAEYIYLNGTSLKDSITFVQKINLAKKNLKQKYIIFIDEAHCLPKSIQDNLLSILEEPAILCFVSPNVMKCVCRDGSIKTIRRGESVQVSLPHNISFVLGTTHRGHLKETILSRLIEITFDVYSVAEIIDIIKDTAEQQLSAFILHKIASMSRNIRGAKKYVSGLRAYKDMNGIDSLTEADFNAFCKIYGISEDGLEINDLKYLSILAEHKTVGLNNLCSLMGVSAEEISLIIEPYLLQKGLVAMTPKGRELSKRGSERMGQAATDGMISIEE